MNPYVVGPLSPNFFPHFRRRQDEASASDLPIDSPWVTGNFYPPGYDEETAPVSWGEAAPWGVEDQEVPESSSLDESPLMSSQNFWIASDSGDVFSSGTGGMTDDHDEAASSTASESAMGEGLCNNCRDKRQGIHDAELQYCFEMKVTALEQDNVVRLCDVISAWTGSQNNNEKPILFCPVTECDNSRGNKIARFQAQATSMDAPIAIIFNYPGEYDTEAVINHTVSLPEFSDFGPWGNSTTPGHSGRQHWGRLETLVREVQVDNDHGDNHGHRSKRTLTFMRKDGGGGHDGDTWTCIDKDSE